MKDHFQTDGLNGLLIPLGLHSSFFLPYIYYGTVTSEYLVDFHTSHGRLPFEYVPFSYFPWIIT